MADRTDALTGGEGPLDRTDRPGEPDRADQEAGATDPGVIRAEIRETRDRLGDTLEEIGERLNPGHIKEQVTEQVKDNIRDATIGRVETMARSAAGRASETRHTVVDTIRENPVPVAIVGIGLSWILMNRRRQGRYAESRYAAAGYGYAGGPYGRDPYARGAEAGGMSGEPGAVGRERASNVGEQVRETAGELAERAQDAARQVTTRAQDVAGTARDRTRYQAGQLKDQFYENPLAIGAAALALGLAAGIALPRTEREVEFMGGARDRLVDRVRGAAEKTKDKVQQVAGRVMDEAQTTAKETAREQGLTT